LKEPLRFEWAVAALGLQMGPGCIPDLPADRATSEAGIGVEGGGLPDADAGFDAGPVSLCGDGYIDLEAGEQCDPGPGATSLTGVCSAKCQMECAAGFVWSRNNHCYWYWADAGTTTVLDPNALSACDSLAGHVVTFASEAEFEAIEQNLQLPKTDPPFWIGLGSMDGRSYVSDSIAPYEPGWDPTCPGCYAALNSDGMIPRYLDTDGGLSSQACVAAFPDGLDSLWHQRPCSGVKTRVLCEREPVGAQYSPCEAGMCLDLVATWANKRYVLSTVATTADVAEQSCAALRGRLVVLQSRDEREQLWLQLSRAAPTVSRVWIGLSLQDGGLLGDSGSSQWVWDDGTAVEAPDAYPPPWGDRQPAAIGSTPRAYLRAFMGEIDDTLARNDEPVQTIQTMPYVCELPASPVP
jgi:hypothetical protein